MRNKSHHIFIFLSLPLILFGQETSWNPVSRKIESNWSSQVHPQGQLAQYPHTQLERPTLKTLNGIWENAMEKNGEKVTPTFEGKLLVPIAEELALCGVVESPGKDHELGYHRLHLSLYEIKITLK
jgi:hypothetical protein